MIEDQIKKAVEVLKQGGVIAYPTDTVYGLGADISNKEAVMKIFELKRRNPNKPLSIACCGYQMVRKYAQITPEFNRLMLRLMPGPVTIIFPKKDTVPNYITCGRGEVGVRIPNDNASVKIIKGLGRPITTTSANRSGDQEISDYNLLSIPVDYVVKGICVYKKPSTVINAISGKIIR